MRIKYLVLAAVAGAAVLSGAALAHGSVAIGLPPDYADEGFAVGYAMDYLTRGEADEVAMDQCRQQATEQDSKAQHAACRVVASVDGQCVAVAYDAETGTLGFGWAIADRAEDAERQALDECKAASTPDRAAFCAVEMSDCDAAE